MPTRVSELRSVIEALRRVHGNLGKGNPVSQQQTIAAAIADLEKLPDAADKKDASPPPVRHYFVWQSASSYADGDPEPYLAEEVSEAGVLAYFTRTWHDRADPYDHYFSHWWVIDGHIYRETLYEEDLLDNPVPLAWDDLKPGRLVMTGRGSLTVTGFDTVAGERHAVLYLGGDPSTAVRVSEGSVRAGEITKHPEDDT